MTEAIRKQMAPQDATAFFTGRRMAAAQERQRERPMDSTHLQQLIAAAASIVWLVSFVQTVFDEIKGAHEETV